MLTGHNPGIDELLRNELEAPSVQTHMQLVHRGVTFLAMHVTVDERHALVTQPILHVTIWLASLALALVGEVAKQSVNPVELEPEEWADRFEVLKPCSLGLESRGVHRVYCIVVAGDEVDTTGACVEPIERALVRVHGDIPKYEHHVVLLNNPIPVLCKPTFVLLVYHNGLAVCIFEPKTSLSHHQVMADVRV